MPAGKFGSVSSKMKPRASLIMNPKHMKSLDRRMQRAIQKALDIGMELLRSEASAIKNESQDIVPYDTGNLHDSAHFRVRRQKFGVTADIWYDTNKAFYAWGVHENFNKVTFHHGKQEKFLEIPIREHESQMDDIWAYAFRNVYN